MTAAVALLLPVILLGSPRVGTFRADVTPPPGEPLIWITPVVKVEDPLWAKGIVLEDGGRRYLLCAMDWCGISNSTLALLRSRLARAAGTEVSRVALHSVHQHTAPYVDGDAYRLLEKLPQPPLRLGPAFLDQVASRLAAAVKESLARLEPFDRIGTGEGRVSGVASARRILAEGGKLLTRYSGDGRKPEMAALPEGAIDPLLKTVTLARGDRPLVRIHYYATHPQTFCCDGRVSGDFVALARERLERKESVFQLYFTGCSGDVTVGKYNDGSQGARENLARRLEEGMQAAIAATRLDTAGRLDWRTAPLALPARADAVMAGYRAKLEAPGKFSGTELYRAAIAVAYAGRKQPLESSSLEIGRVRILHLPGEPMLEFQTYAQRLRPENFVAVAGYGDISPGYLCTDQAFAQGGYEPSASNAGPGTEALVKEAIRKLLGR
jgi:hypothetical protein